MRVNGKPYASSKALLREIGVLLEAKAMHLHLAGLSAVARKWPQPGPATDR